MTLGLSPKVYVPALASLVAGIVLLVLGFDVEGRTAIVTALGAFGLGYQSDPGEVAPNVGADSDAGLPDEIIGG